MCLPDVKNADVGDKIIEKGVFKVTPKPLENEVYGLLSYEISADCIHMDDQSFQFKRDYRVSVPANSDRTTHTQVGLDIATSGQLENSLRLDLEKMRIVVKELKFV